MVEVNGLVTQTALAIRDADELEVAASVLDAALRRAKVEEWREAARLSRMRSHDHALAISRTDDVLHRGVEFAKQIEAERIAEAFDARAAQIEEGE